MCRLLMLAAATSIACCAFINASFAQSTRETVTPPANLHPPINLDADTLRARIAPSHLGLKPNSYSNSGGLGLPYGIDYSREAKGLVVPLDQRSEWGVGVGLNLNSSEVVELSPSSALGQQLKRAPGVMLNRKF
jgi:hypothetical protein